MRGLDGSAVVGAACSGRSTALVAGAAGGMSVLAAAIGPLFGALAAGLLASIPVISGSVVLAEHAAGRRVAAVLFLRGYVGGLAGRAMFGAVFALLASRIGVPSALLLALVVAGLSAKVAPGRWSVGVARIARGVQQGRARL